MAYNTGNPVGSSDFRDLSDNAVSFDKFSVGSDPAYLNRFGALKLSIEGMNQEFNNAQTGRESAFQEFLADSAFVFIGDYAAGLNFTNRSQYTIRDGVAYRLSPSATLPYTSTGNWGTEAVNFTPISSDDILRQDLADIVDPAKGAALVSGVERKVPSVAALRTIPKGTAVTVATLGYYGPDTPGATVYRYDATDTTSSDNGGSVIVATDGGRYKAVHNNTMDVTQWGVVSDGTSQSARMQAAVDWASTVTTDTRGPRGGLTSPVHFPITISESLVMDTPIRVRFGGWLLYTAAAGAAVLIGKGPITGQIVSRYFYDLEFAGIQATTFGNTALPTGYDMGLNHGIEIRNMQFSRIRVDSINTFKGSGIFFNNTNNIYQYQHTQDNDIDIGIIEYTGMGIMMQSVDAALGACQVNRIKIQNIAQCYQQLCVGNPNGQDFNTNDNVFDILALEGASRPDEVGVTVFGLYNKFNISYCASKIAFQGHADANRMELGNPGVRVNDYTIPSLNNQWRCGHPNPGSLPATVASPIVGTNYINTWGVPVTVYATVTLVPTATQSAVAQGYQGKNEGSLSATAFTRSTAQSAPHSVSQQMSFVVQPGGAWQIANTGGAGTTVAIESMMVHSFGI